jgi:hypothetical protein
MTPHLRRTKFPEFCTPANSRLRRFQSSCIREFPAPEKHTLRIPLDFDVSRVMYFPEFPNSKLMLPEKKTVKDPPRKTCSHKYGSFRPQTHHLTPPFPSSNPLPTTPCITNRMRGCGSSYMLARLGHASMSSSACM